ncbi:hypothetical protein IC757_03430 [Wenzhouxiangella sp. AB-CW3]|uniref:InlB B-repeat-containing protein n=1 Tax=Wenzhouxiangella sp. AB-CW3 TaxID=2771012 RepID=UPI00168A9165|nr:hypothetical protein [Wenzhouxiangella sp. AB-CW3]QOC23217.1 hypothetical protein IC757_03430 [Wenzhouxiangella sp. AB-CW3]
MRSLAAGLAGLLLAATASAAELRLIDGEYRVYENGVLVDHLAGARALPDDEQVALTVASAIAEPTSPGEDQPGVAIAQATWTFEIEVEPDTDEQIGDPVCVAVDYQAMAETSVEGEPALAAAGAGGLEGTAEAEADADAGTVQVGAGAPPAALLSGQEETSLQIETEFPNIEILTGQQETASEQYYFIAQIGDFVQLTAGSYAAAAAIYPGSAEAEALSFMEAELQPEPRDCPLTLTALVVSAGGSVEIGTEQPDYRFGDEVEITAVPEEGWRFAGWGGDAAGMSNPLTLTISNNTEVTALFELEPQPVPVNRPLALLMAAGLMMLLAWGFLSRRRGYRV